MVYNWAGIHDWSQVSTRMHVECMHACRQASCVQHGATHARMCAHICMYACLYVCMYICTWMYVRTYVRMYVGMYVCMYVGMYVCMYVCTLRACVHARMQARSVNCMRDACMYIYVHAWCVHACMRARAGPFNSERFNACQTQWQSFFKYVQGVSQSKIQAESWLLIWVHAF